MWAPPCADARRRRQRLDGDCPGAPGTVSVQPAAVNRTGSIVARNRYHRDECVSSRVTRAPIARGWSARARSAQPDACVLVAAAVVAVAVPVAVRRGQLGLRRHDVEDDTERLGAHALRVAAACCSCPCACCRSAPRAATPSMWTARPEESATGSSGGASTSTKSFVPAQLVESATMWLEASSSPGLGGVGPAAMT